MEFSGVRPPNSRMVTSESVASLKRFESEHVPKKVLPLAVNKVFRPEAAGLRGVTARALTGMATRVASTTRDVRLFIMVECRWGLDSYDCTLLIPPSTCAASSRYAHLVATRNIGIVGIVVGVRMVFRLKREMR